MKQEQEQKRNKNKNKNETKTQTRTQEDANKKTNNITKTKHEPNIICINQSKKIFCNDKKQKEH